MNKNILIVVLLLFLDMGWSQEKPKIQKMLVDISCGQCQFGMKQHDCDLAVRINSIPYFVKGKGIDDFGDAHAKDGFCSVIRKGYVTGTIKKMVFEATEIILVPFEKEKLLHTN